MAQLTCPYCKGTGKKQDWSVLGAKAKKIRESAGMSLRDLAAIVGCSPMFLSDLERGRRGWHGPKAQKALAYLLTVSRK